MHSLDGTIYDALDIFEVDCRYRYASKYIEDLFNSNQGDKIDESKIMVLLFDKAERIGIVLVSRKESDSFIMRADFSNGKCLYFKFIKTNKMTMNEIVDKIIVSFSEYLAKSVIKHNTTSLPNYIAAFIRGYESRSQKSQIN